MHNNDYKHFLKIYLNLKGVFAKKGKGAYYRWCLLLILRLSVASLRRKLLKTTHTDHTNSEIGNINDLDREKKINLITTAIIIDNFSTHWYKLDIS